MVRKIRTVELDSGWHHNHGVITAQLWGCSLSWPGRSIPDKKIVMINTHEEFYNETIDKYCEFKDLSTEVNVQHDYCGARHFYVAHASGEKNLLRAEGLELKLPYLWRYIGGDHTSYFLAKSKDDVIYSPGSGVVLPENKIEEIKRPAIITPKALERINTVIDKEINFISRPGPYDNQGAFFPI
jgi:hypothetical protein